MNIAFDISPLTSGHSGRGIGSYTDQLIKALQKYETQNTYQLFTRGQNIPKNADLVHIPYFDPFFLTLPFPNRIPTVVTVHDLIPIKFKTHFPRGIRGEIKWQIQKNLLKMSSHVITDSEASKKDIVDYIHIRSDRVTPIYLAPAEQYQKVEDEKILRKIREKYSLNQPYILYVGDVNWNKNILGLLEAFRIVKTELKTSVNSSLNLVLAGSAFKKDNLAETRTIKAYIEKTGINQDIIRTGFVPDADLCGLYTGAMVLVQPSFAEGFGLVPLEAMASGCITLVSDNSSLSEIAGPSGLCDPNNPRDMADKLIRLINLSDKNRQNLIAQGISWAKTFSWQKTARATSLVYEKVLAG